MGLSCIFPKAPDVQQFWQNILGKVNAITEVPAERFDPSLYCDSNSESPDKISSRWGGFIGETQFSPEEYGIPPLSVPFVDPAQLLTLKAVNAAVNGSGYAARPLPKERTAVIVGSGSATDMGQAYAFRALLPHYLSKAGWTPAEVSTLLERLAGILPSWTTTSFAGLLPNVVAARIANYLDLGGPNYCVDAACASSLAALRLATSELQSGSSDLVIVAAVDTGQSPLQFLCFGSAQVLSPRGQCRPFDRAADGTVLGEGVAVVLLERLEDAVGAGDQVYAVLKAVGASSDGGAKGLVAPHRAGQVRALTRAYEAAAIPPGSVGLLEAHGTGTAVGDRTELAAATQFFGDAGVAPRSCALGSVKSMIGHTKHAAGLAGVIKATLALHHKVLPPTIGVETPQPKIDGPTCPFYLNTESRPWMRRADGTPRRAGVSAAGLGGTNFHAVLEEYLGPSGGANEESPTQVWPAELFVWRAASATALGRALREELESIEKDDRRSLRDAAASVCEQHGTREGDCALAIVAASREDLIGKLAVAQDLVAGQPARAPTFKGVYFASTAAFAGSKVALLFPGQGSQRVDMLRDVAVAFPAVRQTFESADEALGDCLGKRLSDYVFPPPALCPPDRQANDAALRQTRVAQAALGAAGLAMYRLVDLLGIRADMMAGHSYGEWVALGAAGALSFSDLIRLSEQRGRIIEDAVGAEPGAMAAVGAGEAEVRALIDGVADVVIANLNGPLQTVVSGASVGIEEVLRRSAKRGLSARLLPVACAFHSPLLGGAEAALLAALRRHRWRRPRISVYANASASPYPGRPAAVRQALAEHVVRPVRFAASLDAMFTAGARVFVEIGPGSALTGLVHSNLEGRPHSAIALDQASGHGVVNLLDALARLVTTGVRFDTSPLFAGRLRLAVQRRLGSESARAQDVAPTTWLVRPGRVRRAYAPGEAAAAVVARAGTSVAPQAEAALSDRVAAGASPLPANAAAARDREPAPGLMQAHHEFVRRLIETESNVIVAYLQRRGRSAAPKRIGPTAPRADSVTEVNESTHSVASSLLRLRVKSGVIANPGAESLAPVCDLGPAAIADDGTGAAASLVRQLRAAGLEADVFDPTQSPPRSFVRSLIYLTPAVSSSDLEVDQFGPRLDKELKDLWMLVRHYESGLRQEGAVLVATRMGGAFATGDAGRRGFWPGSGGVCGFLKSLRHEWPSTTCRIVDFEPTVDREYLAKALMTELGTRDEPFEVGYVDGRRRTLTATPAALGLERTGLELDGDSVILLTGGARGITAETAVALAETFHGRLVLLGRTPTPPVEESRSTVGVVDPRQLKETLADELRRGEATVTPRVVEQKYRELMQQREIRRNLARVRAAGSAVEYLQTDVAEEIELAGVLDSIYRRYRRLDGVVHGAGVLDDRLVTNLTSESFEKVVRVKVNAALALSKHLRWESLRFLVFYSSIAARYGNAGQAIYAAANEVLNKLAVYLNARKSARVVAINWGPWSAHAGMVSPSAAGRFAAAGLGLISAARGRQALVDELLFGRREDAEVLWLAPAPSRVDARSAAVFERGLAHGGE